MVFVLLVKIIGTNDCGGLKVAHVGIGLSGAEASTVAPFTSQQKHITDVLKIIREGRCALETSFTAFKFMTLYPIIQLTMAAVLYHLGSAVSNNQYLLDDLGIVLFLGIFICWTEPARELTVERPPDSLFSPVVMSSIFGQVLVYLSFFAAVTNILPTQNWFCSFKEHYDLNFQAINGGCPNYLYDLYLL